MRFLIFVFLLIQFSCRQKSEETKAQEIINRAILVSGGDAFKNLKASFTFRKFDVSIDLEGGKYNYSRTQKDSLGNLIVDYLDNKAFYRTTNGERSVLTTKQENSFKESLNSIAYFALLPYKLSDPAVNTAYLGEFEIARQTFDKVKVWFDQEGGGQDHTDVFCYWFNKKTGMLDYLAYDNGGPRFRKAIRRHESKGVILQDYENYKIADSTIKTWEYDKVFDAGEAILFSTIEHRGFKVE